jgi:hypothetical protein
MCVYRKLASSLSLTRLCQNPRYQSCFETLIVGWKFRTVGMLYLAILEGTHIKPRHDFVYLGAD